MARKKKKFTEEDLKRIEDPQKADKTTWTEEDLKRIRKKNK